MKTEFHSALILFVFIFTATGLFADDIDMKNLVKGESFKTDRGTYQILTEYYSIMGQTDETADTNNNAISKIDDSQWDVIKTRRLKTQAKQKKRYSIIKSESGQRSTSSIQVVDTQTTYPVVINNKTHKTGILNGQISIKLKNMSDADVIAEELDLSIVRKFPHLNLVIFSVKNNQDILDLNESLAEDSRIKRRSIEVIENLRVEH